MKPNTKFLAGIAAGVLAIVLIGATTTLIDYPTQLKRTPNFPDNNSAFANFGAACTAAQSSGTFGLLLSKSWLNAPTQTITCNVNAVSGGKIQPANGSTITITGSFTGDLSQHFDTSLGGTVLLKGPVGNTYPQWFGAVADGVTNDLAAIQSAVYAVCRNGTGGTVYIPGANAVYAVVGGINIGACFNFQVTGDKGVTLRVPNGTVDTPWQSLGTYGFDSTLKIIQSTNIKISNLKIDGNLSNRTANVGSESDNSNILVQLSTNVYIDNMDLEGSTTDCVDSATYGASNDFNTNVQVTNNYCNGARRNGFSLTAQHGYLLSGNYEFGAGFNQPLTCASNVPCAGSGVDVEPVSTTSSTDVYILNNTFFSNAGWFAASIAGLGTTRLTFQGNHIYNNLNSNVNGAAGLNIDSNDGTNYSHGVIVDNNEIVKNGWWGIIARATFGLSITNNYIAFNALQGIGLYNVVGANITGNYLEGNGGGGIASAAGAVHNVLISGNILKNNCTTAGSAFSLANFPSVSGVPCPAIYVQPADSNSMLAVNSNLVFNDFAYTPLSSPIIFGTGSASNMVFNTNTCRNFNTTKGSSCVQSSDGSSTYSGIGNIP